MKKTDIAKPSDCGVRRLAKKKLDSKNKLSITYNSSDFRVKSQALPTKNDRLTNLIGKVRDKRLTESLEILEKSGFTGDLALFVLGEIAVCGVGDE